MQEPKFTIRAQDALAVRAIRYYQELAYRQGLYAHAEEVSKAVAEVVEWQLQNPSKVKMPFHKHLPGGE